MPGRQTLIGAVVLGVAALGLGVLGVKGDLPLPGRSSEAVVVFESPTNGLDIGSPVYYRRIAVGQVVSYRLDSTGKGVDIQVFVDAPNDAYVNEGTRFWNASGVDFSVDARGLDVRSQSLLSVIVGGVAFDSIETRHHAAAKPEATFVIYPSETAARAQPDGMPLHIRMRFDQSVRGLSVGAPIDAFGASVGQVDAIGLELDRTTNQFYALVDATLYPERLGAKTFEEIREYSGSSLEHPSGKLMAAMIEQGLRAQLRIGNLLTGQLYIAMAVFPDAKPVTFKMEEAPFIPTVPNNLDQLQLQLNSILTKIEKIPLEDLGAELGNLLQGTSRLVKRLDTQLAPEASAMLRQASRSLGAVGGALAGHEIERNIRQQQTVTHYELTVRLNDGSTRQFRSAQPFAFASGDHVRVENNQLLRG